MYRDNIIVFNRKATASGDVWYPTALTADVNIDKAALVAKYGETAKNTAKVHVAFSVDSCGKHIGAKTLLTPKAWQEGSSPASTITFADGQAFDFIIFNSAVTFENGTLNFGTVSKTAPISDDDFPQGLYELLKAQYDGVFAIDSVAEYSVIPHLEILAR